MKKPTKAELAQIRALRLHHYLGQVNATFDRLAGIMELIGGAKIEAPEYVFANFQTLRGFIDDGKKDAHMLAHELGVKL